MNITKKKWEEAKTITENLEKSIMRLKSAGICPGEREILSARQLNKLLDECMEELEAEMCAMYEEHGPSEDCDMTDFSMCGSVK